MRTPLGKERELEIEVERLRVKCTAEKETADCAMQEAVRLRTVNAALLEALEDCLREHGGFTIKGGCEKRANAAIALAKGEK